MTAATAASCAKENVPTKRALGMTHCQEVNEYFSGSAEIDRG